MIEIVGKTEVDQHSASIIRTPGHLVVLDTTALQELLLQIQIFVTISNRGARQQISAFGNENL